MDVDSYGHAHGSRSRPRPRYFREASARSTTAGYLVPGTYSLAGTYVDDATPAPGASR